MFKRAIPIIVGLTLFLALLMFSSTSIIRFTEVGVKTQLGEAKEGAILNEPGLKWKLPYPIEQITKYDKRIRLIEAQSETQQTADDFQIVVQAYLSYRVSDPLEFFRSFSNEGSRSEDHFRGAENNVMRDLLRSALGETSKFRMEELFAVGDGVSQIGILEKRVMEQLQSRQGGDSNKALADYGIEVVSVGIDRIILPEETTDSVIKRMGAVRDRLAERFESEGRSQAQAIEAEASANADKILAFARRRADEILARGEAEAAPYLAEQNINPELAVFIQNISLMKEAMAKKFTLIFSTSDFGMQLFDPDIIAKTRGRLPVPGSVEQNSIAGGED